MKVSIPSAIILALVTYYRLTDALPVTLHRRGDTAPATPDYPVVDIVDPAALIPDTTEGDEGDKGEDDNGDDDDNKEDDAQPSHTHTPLQSPTVVVTLVPVVNIKATGRPGQSSISTTVHMSPSHATPSELPSSDPSPSAPLISPSQGSLPPSSVITATPFDEYESTTLSPTETCLSSTLSLEPTLEPTPTPTSSTTSDTSSLDSCLEEDFFEEDSSTTLSSMISTTPVPLPTGGPGSGSPQFHHGDDHIGASARNGTAVSRFRGYR